MRASFGDINPIGGTCTLARPMNWLVEEVLTAEIHVLVLLLPLLILLEPVRLGEHWIRRIIPMRRIISGSDIWHLGPIWGHFRAHRSKVSKESLHLFGKG